MKIFPLIIVVTALCLSACEDAGYVSSPVKINAQTSWVNCSNAMLRVSLDRAKLSSEEAREKLYACDIVSDDLFIEKAKEEFKRQARFKDPSSVQYEGVRTGIPLKIKGQYNAKNSYGAYTGFKSFEVGISVKTGMWYVKTYDR